jgi:hypothetical protein
MYYSMRGISINFDEILENWFGPSLEQNEIRWPMD